MAQTLRVAMQRCIHAAIAYLAAVPSRPVRRNGEAAREARERLLKSASTVSNVVAPSSMRGRRW